MPAQRPHTRPSAQTPSHPYAALLSSTGETCSRFWGTDWPSKPRRDPMPCTQQDRLQSWAGSLGGSRGEDPKGAEATPLLAGPFQGLCTIPFDTALPQPCTGFIVLHRLQPLKPGCDSGLSSSSTCLHTTRHSPHTSSDSELQGPQDTGTLSSKNPELQESQNPGTPSSRNPKFQGPCAPGILSSRDPELQES